MPKKRKAIRKTVSKPAKVIQASNVCTTCNTKGALITLLALVLVIFLLYQQNRSLNSVDDFLIIDGAGEAETNAYQVGEVPIMIHTKVIHDRGQANIRINNKEYVLEPGDMEEVNGVEIHILKIIAGHGQQRDLVVYGLRPVK